MPKYVFVAWLLCVTPSVADVRLPKVLCPHMVLQQESDVKIWGWADAGETVNVSGDWPNAKASAQADADGRWQVILKTEPADRPHTITVKGENTITLDDVLFGEVWIASGQSNMEMPLRHLSDAYTGIQDAENEIAAANYPRIRLFQAGNFSSQEPLDDVEAGISMYGIPPAECRWEPCTPETIPTFSSTAYFFARKLHAELQVPIGIIDASWGGTAAEAWTPASGLQELGNTGALEQAATLPQQSDQKVPTRLYNGMIHPLRNLKIQGAVWYQGESNAGLASEYRRLFSTMIGEWRTAFDDDFSFYFVQIAPFNYTKVNAAYLREAQLESLSVRKTGIVVTTDIGNLTDIHPKNKQEVGRRLALWALANDYGRDVVYSGPLFKESVVDGTRIRIKFDHADGLTTSDDGPLIDFEIAGSDQMFHPAMAEIDGEEVLVSSDQVADPQAVQFGFTSQAMPNLMNKEGLPASPFRTDRW